MFYVFDWYSFAQGALTLISLQVVVYSIYRIGVWVGRTDAQD